jgi:cytochrome c-type biogenesis protein CcmF
VSNSALGIGGVTLGLAASLTAAVIIAIGLARRRAPLIALGARYSWLVLVGAVVATIAMQRALITRDFTVEYVAEHGSSRTPPLFNVATMWSALEGSLLLWALVLAGYLAVVLWKFRARYHDPLVGWALLAMLVTCGFFFWLLLVPAHPFSEVTVPPGFDGPGPNPILQNHVLVAFHPPLLYLGFVGFTVPFAFAFAALVTGRLGEGWLLETRRWTLFAWGFLTAGILLGAWWAYDVLGWGGYWGWDPVENASLLPWLTGTAYLHSVLVQERRGMLRVWNLSLVCATFALTILSTFLTRSGVVQSVHAFSEGSIGPWLLGFFGLIVAVTVGLIGWRGDRLRAPGKIDSPLSREGAFLANNLAFAGLAFVILLGTVAPLIIEALRGDRISVGPPYFTRMTMPLGLTLLFLMALAPVLPWRKAAGVVLRDRLEWPAWGGVVALVLGVLLGGRDVFELIAYGLAGFAAGSAIRQLVTATRRQGWRGLVGRANGGMIVHLGVIVLAVGFAASANNARQGQFDMSVGQTVTLDGHEITYLGSEDESLSNRLERRAIIEVDGEILTPGNSRFLATGQVVRTPGTRSTLTRDVQLSLDVPPETTDGDIVLRATFQPLVSWLWWGGALMLVGTAFSAFPTKSHRRPTDPISSPIALDDHEAGLARIDERSEHQDAGDDAEGGPADEATPVPV